MSIEASNYLRDGFVVLRNVVSPGELDALREETAAQIDAGHEREPRSDFKTKPLPDGNERFFRIQFLTSKMLRNDSMLLALGHPVICELVEELLGPDWTTYGSAMVFKAPGGGPAIELHRDTRLEARVFDETHRFFNVDIYLDRATPSTGCLRVLPGSQRIDDVREIVANGVEPDGFVDVPMEPGDVLFHDSLLLHASLATPADAPLRRVLYYSYQSAAWMEREGVIPGWPVSRNWIARQMKLVQHAIQRRGLRYDVPPEWVADVDAAELELRPVQGDLPWELAAAAAGD